MLDRDTRDYLLLLVHGAGKGLEGRGGDLREVFRLFEPTHRDLARLNSSVATRKVNLRRLVTSLERLSSELAGREDELADLVSSAVARVPLLRRGGPQHLRRGARAAERAAPDDEHRAGGRAACRGARPCQRGPAPAVARARALSARPATALDRGRAAAARGDPPVRARGPPDGPAPAARRARPAALDAQHDPLVRGAEPAVQHGRLQQGRPRASRGPGPRRGLPLLPRLAAAQLGHACSRTADAHGPFRPSLVAGSCQTLRTLAADRPESEFALNLTPILTNPTLCGE